MFVLFDGLALQTGSRQRGIGRYSANLLAGLRRARPGWQIHLVMHDYLAPIDHALTEEFPVRVFRSPIPVSPDTREVADRYFADWLTAQNADWVFHPSLFEFAGAVPRYGDVKPPRTAAVLYDLIPLVFPDDYLSGCINGGEYSARFRAACGMDLLLAISQASADDAVRLMGSDAPTVVNIRGAADENLAPLPPDRLARVGKAAREKFGLAKPFILYVGGFDLRKNMAGAIRGYAALPPAVRAGHDLVLACWLPDEVLEPLRHLTRHLGIEESVKFTGFVSDEELVALYQTCRVFFFPSLYEGLGLPPVEAMQCGAPVVTSDCSSMPEYGGPVSWYCDPTSPVSMAEALRKALAEPRELRRAERERFAAQFNWADVAERTARAIELASPIPAVSRKPRVAWVCPAPPTETGIADYAAEVANVLADRFELEWVTDPANPPPDAAVARRAAVVPANEVDARHAARPFDLFVYHMGNNYFHTYMLPLMRRHPGAVIVHDLHLGGLFRLSHEGVGVWPGSWAEELEYNGDWHLSYWTQVGHMHPHVVPTFGPLNRRVLEAAPFLITHSRWGWQQIRRVTDAPVSVVPHIATDPRLGTRAEERIRLGLPADRFIVSTLGHVGPPKRVPALIRAAAELPPDVRARTTVLIVGPVSPDDRKHFQWLAETLGIPGQIEVRGRVPLDDFPAYALAADACVQLRYPSHGETSGALTRAMAAGACCITSDMPTMAEIPNTATIKVRSPIRDVADLTAALTKLARDPDLRDRLGANARQYMAETHGPAVIAAKYAAAIEHAVGTRRAADGAWLAASLNALADLPGGVPDGLIEQWARLRTKVLRPAIAADDLPELPDVPAERQTGKHAA